MEFVRVWWTYIRPSMYFIYVIYVRDLKPLLLGTSYNSNHNEPLPIPLSFQKSLKGVRLDPDPGSSMNSLSTVLANFTNQVACVVVSMKRTL